MFHTWNRETKYINLLGFIFIIQSFYDLESESKVKSNIGIEFFSSFFSASANSSAWIFNLYI